MDASCKCNAHITVTLRCEDDDDRDVTDTAVGGTWMYNSNTTSSTAVYLPYGNPPSTSVPRRTGSTLIRSRCGTEYLALLSQHRSTFTFHLSCLGLGKTQQVGTAKDRARSLKHRPSRHRSLAHSLSSRRTAAIRMALRPENGNSTDRISLHLPDTSMSCRRLSRFVCSSHSYS